MYKRQQIAKPKKYIWEEPHFNEADDPFLKHFDENGNFIESIEEPEIEEEQTIIINYTYKKAED